MNVIQPNCMPSTLISHSKTNRKIRSLSGTSLSKSFQNARRKVPHDKRLSLLSSKLHKNYTFLVILIKKRYWKEHLHNAATTVVLHNLGLVQHFSTGRTWRLGQGFHEALQIGYLKTLTTVMGTFNYSS